MTTAPTRTPPPSRPAPSGPKPSPAPTLASVRKISVATRGNIIPKLIHYAVEGFGKTSFLAHAPDPFIIMSPQERGYTALLSAGRVPAVPAQVVTDWPDLLAWLDSLVTDPQGRKTVGLDAMGGFERLCHEFVCRRDFNGDWGEKGFASFQKGYDVSVGEWLKMLAKLDELHTRHGIVIVLLGHAKVKPFKNPIGADFDRYICDVHDKTWAATARWANAVLFGNYLTIVDQEKRGKGKGIGGTDRILYTERRDAWDAKNQYGLPEQIELSNDPTQTWAQVWSAIVGKDA